MKYNINTIPRPVRRRLQRIVQRHHDGHYRRRANAILHLYAGISISKTASLLQATRVSVRHWRNRYVWCGEAGLVPEQRGRRPDTVTETLCAEVLALIPMEPSVHACVSNFTSEGESDGVRALPVLSLSSAR